MRDLVAALGLVFLAEFGDKTQLVALSLGARYKLRLVLVGVALAYMATNLVSVGVGAILGAALPTRAIGVIGGIVFLWFAWRTWSEGDDVDTDESTAGGVGLTTRGVVMTTATAMFTAELGDKTMLATATLAAKGNPVLVWIGATIGIILAGASGAVIGRVLGDRLPARTLRIGSAALFAVFGCVLLIGAL